MIKKEIINKYNISDATIRNWKKLGYIKSLSNIDEEEIKNVLYNKDKNRKNKKSDTKNIVPASYVEDLRIIKIVESILFLKNTYEISNNEIMISVIKKLLGGKSTLQIEEEMRSLFGKESNNREYKKGLENIDFTYDSKDDFLGCLYMSILSVGNRDTNGIFYTPSRIVDEVISKIDDLKKVKSITDSGCGSGNFLIKIFIKLAEERVSEYDIIDRITGYDIDPIAVFLSKINIYLLTKEVTFGNVKIYCKDFIMDDIGAKYDVIVGNPPWGKKYTKKENSMISLKYGTEFAKSDSFSQFIIRSMSCLNNKGQLVFVLPSSILNIRKHEYIRKFMLNKKIASINHLGREFEEIVTDVIILKLNNDSNARGNCIYDGAEVSQSLFAKRPYHNFLVSDVVATTIIEKLTLIKSTHLIKNVDYALGIVTGNNNKYLQQNSHENNEAIICGKNLRKYFVDYDSITNYITFNKSELQQVAPEKLYRAKKKILYKFIGKRLTFCLENKQMLSLNSANVICLPDNFNEYYVVAVLNSRLIQLLFDELYNTHKVLKNHIQFFPIFDISSRDKKKITDILKSSQTSSTTEYIEKIEDILYKAVGLTDIEIAYLKERY